MVTEALTRQIALFTANMHFFKIDNKSVVPFKIAGSIPPHPWLISPALFYFFF